MSTLPYVVVQTAVSVDGRIDHFLPDVGRFYELASRWAEDATLAGNLTVCPPGTDPDPDGPRPDPTAGKPLLLVPDSRGRVRNWRSLRSAARWGGMIALVSSSTPRAYVEYLADVGVHVLSAGSDHVDLRAALLELAERFGVRTVRVDSGGTLTGVLLRQGLVSEVSVLTHPVLVGGTSPASMYRAPDLTEADVPIAVELLESQQLAGGLVWTRYRVCPGGSA